MPLSLCTDNESIIETVKNEYDLNGNKIKSLYIKDGAVTNSEWKYDADGKMTEAVYFDSNGKMKQKSIYSIDAAGNKTETLQYDSNGKVSFRMIHLESEGQTIFDIIYSGNGEIFSDTEEKRDANGNIIERIFYNSGEINLREEWEYGEKAFW